MDLYPQINLYSVITSVTALCYVALIGLFVRQGLRGNRAKQAFCAYLLTMALWQLTYFMVSISNSAETAMFWYRVVVVVVSGQFIIYFIFTRALMQMGGSRAAEWIGLALWAVTGLLSWAIDPQGFFASVHRDRATGLYVPAFGPLVPVVGAPNYFYLGYAILLLIRAYRRKSYMERRRIQYLLMGITLVVFGLLVNFYPPLQAYPIDVITQLINAGIITYAILRYQLLDIRLVIRKGLLYTIPTAIIGFTYFFVSSLAVAVFHLVAGYQLLVSLVVAAITAAIAQPLRDRVQAWVDRHFFREKYDSSLMLQRLSSTAASVLDLDKLAGMILDEVAWTMHVSRTAFFVKHEESGEFWLAARRGIDQEAAVVLRMDHPLVQWLSGHEGILTKRDIGVMPQFRALWGQERDDLATIGAALFIPLKAEGRLVGIFAVGPRLSEEPYSEDDELSLRTLANQTALAVEKARLYATEQRRLKESLILLDVAAAVSSTLDLTQVLQLIAQRTAEACGVHRCSIFLLDEPGRRILPLMSQFASGVVDERLWQRFRFDTYLQTIDEVPVLSQVIQDRQPLVLGPDSITYMPKTWVEPFGIRSLLIVPLVSRDRVIGTMVLDHVEAEKRFAQEQINLAMTIGSHTAAAIENARLHEQTIEEKAKTEVVLRETFSGIVVVDEQLRIVSMNPGAEMITGHSADQVLGKPLAEVFGEQTAAADGPVAKAIETGEKVPPVETVLSARQGSRDVLLGVTSLSPSKQAPMQYLLSFADISKLKEVDRLKSNIVANVSHELRTPLSSIKAYNELLLLGAEEGDAQLRRDWLSVIDRETDRLATLINNLLDLSRLEAERVELTKLPVDLGGVAADVVSVLQVQAERRGITVELEVQPGLPPVSAEEGLIRSVVRNLTSNAIKFSREGSRVWVSVAANDHNLTLSVADEGIGIPEEAIPHLFTKFFRVQSEATAETQGTGLGLALVKEAVAAHGGRIEVESRLGEGSRFTVVIPKAG